METGEGNLLIKDQETREPGEKAREKRQKAAKSGNFAGWLRLQGKVAQGRIRPGRLQGKVA